MTTRERPDELVLLPLGGMGEIGMNIYCYGFGPANDRKWIMVDCGVKFGNDADPGIDVILPDVSFMESQRSRLLGIVLTHAHEDNSKPAMKCSFAHLPDPILR